MHTSSVPPFAQCPTCSGYFGRWLKVSSEMAEVNYYRCDRCSQVWTVPKGRAEGVRDVAPGNTLPRVPSALDQRRSNPK
jgi:hypothetical protein